MTLQPSVEEQWDTPPGYFPRKYLKVVLKFKINEVSTPLKQTLERTLCVPDIQTNRYVYVRMKEINSTSDLTEGNQYQKCCRVKILKVLSLIRNLWQEVAEAIWAPHSVLQNFSRSGGVGIAA